MGFLAELFDDPVVWGDPAVEAIIQFFTVAGALGGWLLLRRIWPGRKTLYGRAMVMVIGALAVQFTLVLLDEGLSIALGMPNIAGRPVRALFARGVLAAGLWVALITLGRPADAGGGL